MTCAICLEDSVFDYKVCNACRGVLVCIPTEHRSRFIEEMLASPTAHRHRIRERWRDEHRREFSSSRKGLEQGGE